jgi:hypothetical protein
MDTSEKNQEWPALTSLAGDELWNGNYEQDFSYLLTQQPPPPEGLDVQ